jgi:hypothetical protein
MFVFLRRYLALAALLFWQGGFTFYAAVVVPIGQQVLGSHLEQGFITREVTGWLNLSGVVALPLLAGELVLARDPCRVRRWLRASLWLLMALTLAGLYLLHARLDPYLDPVEHTLDNRQAFRPLHRLYLWTNTVQWLAAVVYLGLSLIVWRAEDHGSHADRARGAHAGIATEGGPWQPQEWLQLEAQKNVPPVASSASPSHRSHPTGGTGRS